MAALKVHLNHHAGLVHEVGARKGYPFKLFSFFIRNVGLDQGVFDTKGANYFRAPIREEGISDIELVRE